jgi:RhtB (resistance to homoserine/threonine) family protein
MWIEYWPEFVSLGILNLVALISPGPDFVMTFRNTVFHSRKTGLMTSLGIACGVVVHISYIICGVGTFIAQTVWLLYTIKILGSGYLIYIGWQSLKAGVFNIPTDSKKSRKTPSSFEAFSAGFFTNALNPKAILFFLSVFMVVISPETPLLVVIAYGAEMVLITVLWFSFVAVCLSTSTALSFFKRFGQWIGRLTGGALVGLGIKLALTSMK